MIKIVEIIDTSNFEITCKFNTGVIKKINVLPLLKNHAHLVGIDKLYNEKVFATATIGKNGEILWKNIIQIQYKNETNIWDYDISPEFVYYN